MTVAEQELGVKPIMDPQDVGHEVLSMVTVWFIVIQITDTKQELTLTFLPDR